MKPAANNQYFVLVLLLLWALVAQGTFSGYAIYRQSHLREWARLPFGFRDFSAKVQFLTPEYEAARINIKTNDEVLSINGQKISGLADLEQMRNRFRPGNKVDFEIRRTEPGKPPNTFTVPVLLQTPQEEGLAWIAVIGIFVALPLICLLVGFYIAFARPRDPLAWITMAMLASFGQLVGATIAWSIWSPWRELVLLYHSILGNTWPLWMILFAFYFPLPFAFLKRHRWIIAALAIVPVALTLLDLYGSLMQGHHLADLHWLDELLQRIAKPITFLYIAYVTAFFYGLTYKRRRLTAPDASRRLAVMLNGCGASLTPLIPFSLGQIGLLPKMPPWLAVICLLMLVIFPLTIAYVIVVQRAMDVRMVLRTGLRYALASTGFQIVRIALSVGLVVLTLYLYQQSEHQAQSVVIAAAGIAAIFLLRNLAQKVGHWIDSRFFREAYNAERILTDLSSSVVGIRDTKRLIETVANRIADSLHVPRIAVLLESGGHFQPAYALGFHDGPPPVYLSDQTATIRTLRRLNGPSKIFFDDPQSWIHGTTEPEQSALQKMDTQLLLPLSLDSKILGVISLGAKRSELPYTKADLQLLGAVAAQTGLALENAHLTESIRREIAQRERLDRELEIARDVQQRLFPQNLPLVNGLDFAGYCRPASGVGGDYYDFIHLATGSLGIAVGDVSGKGIAAALMMASLQASLRGQTIRPCETLAEMIQDINRLVYEASSASRYATFFYAQYNPVTRKLKYVNAGHNPPLLRRKKGPDFEFFPLEEGGTVIGLFPNFAYREAEIEMHPGDILVAYTDGISEAMNHQEEEFGEERLMQAIRDCPDRSAASISSSILEKVDAFTAGADQHDDMTIVTVRLL